MSDSPEPKCPIKLKLTNSKKFALIDKEDFVRCQKYNWNLNPLGYAQTTFNHQTIFLHRFIFNLKKGDGKLVDHQSHNTLDCTKNNLRPCNRSQNNSNKKSKLVTRCKQTGKWRVRVTKNKKEVFHKRYDNYETALRAKIIASRMFLGEFAYAK